jgi:hypothetical protein
VGRLLGLVVGVALFSQFRRKSVRHIIETTRFKNGRKHKHKLTGLCVGLKVVGFVVYIVLFKYEMQGKAPLLDSAMHMNSPENWLGAQWGSH